ncbi:hypothetical protein BVRB_1g020210 [Beta vulgaris subsp. vulgaris]|nr:hypothetical protein BVRB_1g020210 [Beta vulgaris subsp. vulgaris]
MAIPRVEEENLVFDIKISSVVPGKITGENKTHELKGIDLAMKLHYLKGLYFFTNNGLSSSISVLSIHEAKKSMFDCLIPYFMACGRIRMSDTSDRPTIKLNDAGVRVVEAKSSKTVDEWLAMEDFLSLQDHLVYNHVLGPDLPFSPLVCLQFTWFRCGGVSVGLSWAHILGDAFSASEFMNTFSQYIQNNHQQPKTISLQNTHQPTHPHPNPTRQPISVKRVGPVGNHWVLPANYKIGIHTLHLQLKQLHQLHSKVYGSKINDNGPTKYFEVITAIIWRSIAKIRKDKETDIVTICRSKTSQRQQMMPYNGQVLSTVGANCSVSSVDPLLLVKFIAENLVEETEMVEELVNKELSTSDFIVYGRNLTFVDMEEVDIYNFKLKGKCPVFASYTVGGIGDKGVVMVLPGPRDGKDGEDDGKVIVLLLPEDEIECLKSEFKNEWCI